MHLAPRHVAVLVSLLVGVLAGCSSPGSPGADLQHPTLADYDAIEKAIGEPLVGDHDHNDASLHTGHYNLDLLATVTGKPGRTPGSSEIFIETAVKGGYAYICRTGSDEALVIVDVHDIEHPKYVGEIHLDAGFEPDVEVSDDGHWAFWETQRAGASVSAPSADDPAGSAPRGVHVIDISNKAAPKWVSFMPIAPDGPHSITYANITTSDGKAHHILFASTYAWQYIGGPHVVGPGLPRVAPPGMQREVILELDTSLAVPRLVQLAEYTDAEANQDVLPASGGEMPHDISVAVHPITHKTLAYVAYWDLGVVILDVSDPAHPVKLGQAKDFGTTPYKAIHMARQFPETIAGKVVVVAEPEIGDEADTGNITLFDVTDPAHPSYISNWKIPGQGTSQGGGLGPHYFDVRDGRVILASYHAGFWAFDVHDATNLAHPRTVAYAFVNAPDNSTSTPVDPLSVLGFGGGADSAFDAWWVDDTHVLGGDVHAGIAVYRYTGPIPAQEE